MCNKTFSLLCLLTLSSAAVFAQKTDYRATYIVDGASIADENRSHISLECLEPDASVVYATNGVKLILTSIRLNKTSGSLDSDTRRETGRNSVLRVDAGSRVTIEKSEINSHTSMADGASAIGEGSVIKVYEGNINVSRSGSAAVNAAKGGKVTLERTMISTYSSQDPALLASVGGEIEATGLSGECSGQASPTFYSHGGTITAQNCKLSSGRWTMGSVDGGKLTLIDNDLQSGGVSGFLLYGSKSRSENGELVLTHNKLAVKDGPLFMVTNTSASITVAGNKISNRSNELLRVCSDDWGIKGSNGGDAVLTIDKQSLSGTITVDSISSLVLNLHKGAKLNGSINSTENRCAQVKVVVSAGSSWNSKGDSYITSIVFEQPLAKGLKQLKGKHVIYYDPANPDNKALEGKEYKTGGGVLRPLK